jgi:hypothetical protein
MDIPLQVSLCSQHLDTGSHIGWVQDGSKIPANSKVSVDMELISVVADTARQAKAAKQWVEAADPDSNEQGRGQINSDQMRTHFDRIDTDQSGKLSKTEILSTIMKMQENGKPMYPTDEDAERAFHLYHPPGGHNSDKDGDGELSFEEWHPSESQSGGGGQHIEL